MQYIGVLFVTARSCLSGCLRGFFSVEHHIDKEQNGQQGDEPQSPTPGQMAQVEQGDDHEERLHCTADQADQPLGLFFRLVEYDRNGEQDEERADDDIDPHVESHQTAGSETQDAVHAQAESAWAAQDGRGAEQEQEDRAGIIGLKRFFCQKFIHTVLV